MHRLAVVAIVAGIAVPKLAHAGAPHFEFLCGHFVDGEAKDVLPSAKKPKLTGQVGCALRMHDAPDDFTGVIALRTVRAKKWTTRWLEASGTPGDDGVDYEWMIPSDQRDPDGVPYWQPCEDFDIQVGVDVPSGATIFKKTIHVAQSCPKPKPIAADVKCTASQGGDTWKLPHKEMRLSDDAKIDCTVTPRTKREVSLSLTGWIEHPDENGNPTTSERHDGDPLHVTFQYADWLECARGTIVLEGKDGDGNVVLSKKIKIDQDCPD